MSTLLVGDMSFVVRRSPRRRSLQITVDRGGELLIFAPEKCSIAAMEGFVREKRFWIYTKLAQKEALVETPRKQFVSGEGFLYLGRSYRLLVVPSQDVPLKLEHGRFRMAHAATAEGRVHMIRWYKDHGKVWLRPRVERYARRLGVGPANLVLQDLGYRWGSCGKGGRLYFNWRTVLLPPSVIDYVIAHELTHFVEPRHTSRFWNRVSRLVPDYAIRKQWLAERGRVVDPI